MKTLRSGLLAIAGFSAILLAGCGDGYEVVKFSGQVPYTDERTAGPGVTFVRAHLMPEKTIVFPEPLLTPQILPQSVPLSDAAPLFEAGNAEKK
ncbi:MAG: hypothetical protein WC989_00405 [Micavibrio sp.]